MLITCSECGKSVSDRAASCPNCGAPLGAIGLASGLSDRKRSVAVASAILLLGILGAHNSYLGYKKRAAIEFVLAVIGVFTFPVGGWGLLFVLWVWGIVEALSYKTDGEGRLLA